MKYDDLRRIFAQLGATLPEPNHAGWCHIPCLFAPWRHRSGHDRSAGFAVKVEPDGLSAYSCPACKSHGRIAKLVAELSALRGVDYSATYTEVERIELLGKMALPPWDSVKINLGSEYEPLPEPLDPVMFDPDVIFDDPWEEPRAAAYLHERRISAEGVAKAGIRYDPDKARLVFPVYDGEGNLHGMSGRSILSEQERTFWSHRDQREITMPKVLDYSNLPKRLLMLGEHRWTHGRGTIIVEGLMAYARFLTEGVDEHFNVGAVMGSAMLPAKAAIMKRWGNPAFLIFDPDEAGDAGLFGPLVEAGHDRRTGEVIHRRDADKGAVNVLAGSIPVFVPNYPEGVTDPDDLTLEQVLTMCRNTPLATKIPSG